MFLRELNVNSENVSNCVFCNMTSPSMFEIQKDNKNTFVCEICLEEISGALIHLSRQIKAKMDL